MSAGAAPWAKRVMQFQPSALRPREESEAHYLGVHSPWAVTTFRGMPELVGYHTNLLVGQWDLTGGFGRTPDLWRYATMRYEPPGMEFSPAVGRMLAHDHQSFLRDLRRFDVEESVVRERSGPALCAEKYVVVLDRPEDLDAAAAAAAVDEVVGVLAAAFDATYGARRMTCDRVLLERENAPMREPGQLPTGRRLDESRRLAFVELYLDHEMWGSELFRRPEVLALQRDSVFAPDAISAYRVLERAGHDRRQ